MEQFLENGELDPQYVPNLRAGGITYQKVPKDGTLVNQWDRPEIGGMATLAAVIDAARLALGKAVEIRDSEILKWETVDADLEATSAKVDPGGYVTEALEEHRATREQQLAPYESEVIRLTAELEDAIAIAEADRQRRGGTSDYSTLNGKYEWKPRLIKHVFRKVAGPGGNPGGFAPYWTHVDELHAKVEPSDGLYEARSRFDWRHYDEDGEADDESPQSYVFDTILNQPVRDLEILVAAGYLYGRPGDPVEDTQYHPDESKGYDGNNEDHRDYKLHPEVWTQGPFLLNGYWIYNVTPAGAEVFASLDDPIEVAHWNNPDIGYPHGFLIEGENPRDWEGSSSTLWVDVENFIKSLTGGWDDDITSGTFSADGLETFEESEVFNLSRMCRYRVWLEWTNQKVWAGEVGKWFNMKNTHYTQICYLQLIPRTVPFIDPGAVSDEQYAKLSVKEREDLNYWLPEVSNRKHWSDYDKGWDSWRGVYPYHVLMPTGNWYDQYPLSTEVDSNGIPTDPNVWYQEEFHASGYARITDAIQKAFDSGIVNDGGFYDRALSSGQLSAKMAAAGFTNTALVRYPSHWRTFWTTEQLKGPILTAVVTDGGSGYLTPTTTAADQIFGGVRDGNHKIIVTFGDRVDPETGLDELSSGMGARGEAIVVDGEITGITITARGDGYANDSEAIFTPVHSSNGSWVRSDHTGSVAAGYGKVAHSRRQASRHEDGVALAPHTGLSRDELASLGFSDNEEYINYLFNKLLKG